MLSFINFTFLSLIKILALLFYRFDIRWLSKQTLADDPDIRLLVLLNHTSLFEPLFIRVATFRLIARMAKHAIIPGADVTTQRPIVGKIFKAMLPGLHPISRKRDNSWHDFLNQIKSDSIVIIMPEGRMRRATGLDKDGNPMTARGGVADILSRIKSGKILFVYSGGLHHIQTPGQKLPRIFQTIKVNLELVDIVAYKKCLPSKNSSEFTRKVIDDMQHRLEHKIPTCRKQPYRQDSGIG